MSKKQNRLKSPKAVLAVVALSVAVVVNMYNYWPAGSDSSALAEAGEVAELFVPQDLIEATRQARGLMAGTANAAGVAGLTSGNWLTGGQSGAQGQSMRDPFRIGGLPDARGAASESEQQAAPSDDGPCCEAVILGGKNPTAIIDGKSYHKGDRIEGYRVDRINENGVLLRDPEGIKFLSLRTRNTAPERFRMVVGDR